MALTKQKVTVMAISDDAKQVKSFAKKYKKSKMRLSILTQIAFELPLKILQKPIIIKHRHYIDKSSQMYDV